MIGQVFRCLVSLLILHNVASEGNISKDVASWSGWTAVGTMYSFIWLSQDGITWEAQDVPEPFYDVAVTETGTRLAITKTAAYISTDGATWSRVGSYKVTDCWAVTWNGSVWWAVGPFIYSGSPDGTQWILHYKGYGSLLRDIACVGPRCVAVGYSGYDGLIMHIDDGHNFAPQAISSANALQSIAYGAGLWVIVGYAKDPDAPVILTSPTGLPNSWTRQSPPPNTDAIQLFGIAWNGNSFAAVGGRGYAIFTSPDGVTWTEQKSGLSPTSSWSGVGWGNGLWVVMSSNITTSKDGVHWTLGARPGSSGIMNNVIYYG